MSLQDASPYFAYFDLNRKNRACLPASPIEASKIRRAFPLRPFISVCHCRVESKEAESAAVMNWRTALAMFATLSASIALADDFKTINGKEYKNVTVSRVEPDGIIVKTKSGISKVYFSELPKEIQERFNYNPEKSAAYSAEQNAALQQDRKQEEQAQAQKQQQEAIVRAENERVAKVEAAIANGEVFIGMTGEQCIRAWGQPEKVNTTDTARGHHSQWVYPGGRYVYFENGILTAIQR